MSTAAVGVDGTPLAARLSRRALGALTGTAAAAGAGAGIWRVVLPWIATDVTRSPVAISGLIAAGAFAGMLLILPIGVILDRWSRRTVAITAASAAALIAGLLGVVVREVPAVPLLYAATFGVAAARVTIDSASETLVPVLVGSERLAAAHGRLWATGQGAEAVTGPLAAAVLVSLSTVVATGAAAAAFAAAAVALAILPDTRSLQQPSAAGQRPTLASVTDGIRIIWRQRNLRVVLIVSSAWTYVLGIALSTLVLFAQDTLSLPASGYAVLVTAYAGGGVVGSVAAAAVLRRLGDRWALQLAVAGSALFLVATALAPDLPLAATGILIAMTLGAVWDVGCLAIVQRRTAAPLLGRVTAAWRIAEIGAFPIGALSGGGVVTLATALVAPGAALRTPFLLAGIVLGIFALVAIRPLAGLAHEGSRTGWSRAHPSQ